MAAAAFLSFTVLRRWVPQLVGFSVGVLLGAALLSLLPEAARAGLPVEHIFMALLGGILIFFVLEKLALWRHEHVRHDNGPRFKPAGLMIVAGDGLCNFVDGVLIAAAFLQSPALGVTTSLAIISHELPQEVGDFMILLDAGYGKRKALLLNGLASVLSVIGGILGYLLLDRGQALVPCVLVLAAASFIYIAVADLVPELHRAHKARGAPLQFALILAGVGIVAVEHL